MDDSQHIDKAGGLILKYRRTLQQLQNGIFHHIRGFISVSTQITECGSIQWIVNIKSDRFYKVRDLLNSAGDKYPSVPCKRMLLNQ